MNQVNVFINGRRYLLNCGAGEEERLVQVVACLNEKIEGLDKITKQSGDTNLMLAAALLATSEVLELRTQAVEMKTALATAEQAERDLTHRLEQNERTAQEAITKTAQRIETLTAMIEEQLSDKSSGEGKEEGQTLHARTA